MTNPLAEHRLTELWNHAPECPRGDQCDCGLGDALDILRNMGRINDQWLRVKADCERKLNIIRNVLDGHYDK